VCVRVCDSRRTLSARRDYRAYQSVLSPAMDALSTEKYKSLVDTKLKLEQKRALNGQLEPAERTYYARLSKQLKQFEMATHARQSLESATSDGLPGSITPTPLAQSMPAGGGRMEGVTGAPSTLPTLTYGDMHSQSTLPTQSPSGVAPMHVQPTPARHYADVQPTGPTTTSVHTPQSATGQVDATPTAANPQLSSVAQRKAYHRGLMEGMDYARSVDGDASMDVDAVPPQPAATTAQPGRDSFIRPGHLVGGALGIATVVGGKLLYDMWMNSNNKNQQEEAEAATSSVVVNQESLADPKAMEEIAKKVEHEAKEKMEAIADEPPPEVEKMTAPNKNSIPIPSSVVPAKRPGKTFLSS
jgi:hypothetical protein